MKTLALFGANGFVGSALFKALKNSFSVSPVTRQNFEGMLGQSFDYVINSAMPSARFKAVKDPSWDFAETVQKTARIFNEMKFKKFIQVSSVSARCQLETVYGRHKAEAEAIANNGESLIVRLGPMYGPTLAKGVLIDMLKGNKVFVAAQSRYCFAPLEFVAGWIANNLEVSGVREVGARDSMALGDLSQKLGLKIQFEGPEDHQEIVSPEKDFPEVKLVLDFMKNKLAGAK